jgi:2-keto-4-pentenoate hydratase
MERSTMSEAIEAIAAALRTAQETASPIDPVRDAIGAGGAAAAYAVQRINVERAVAAGRRVAGRKIGLTARSVQQQLGVDQPDYGALYADCAYEHGAQVPTAKLIAPKVEGEVALVLERDLRLERPGVADVMRATAYAVAAIEIVDSRIRNWDIRLTDTIADNASGAAFVLGCRPVKLESIDLELAGMQLLVNGRTASLGVGAACLEHPLAAAAWLARRMVEAGTPLAAGEVVLTGALGPMVPVAGGEVAEARIAGLGSVRIEFGRRG